MKRPRLIIVDDADWWMMRSPSCGPASLIRRLLASSLLSSAVSVTSAYPLDFGAPRIDSAATRYRIAPPQPITIDEEQYGHKNSIHITVDRTQFVCFFLLIYRVFFSFFFVLLNFTEFNGVLLGYGRCYQVSRVLPGFTLFASDFTRFYRVLPGFTGFSWVSLCLYRIFPGFTEFYWVSMDFARFHQVSLYLIELNWILFGCTRPKLAALVNSLLLVPNYDYYYRVLPNGRRPNLGTGADIEPAILIIVFSIE